MIVDLFIITVPLFGVFYPFESYLGFGFPPGSVSVPIPVTTLILTLCLAILFYDGARADIRRIYLRPETLLLLFYALLALATFLWATNAQYTLFRSARLLPSIGFGLLFAAKYDLKKLCTLMTAAFFIAAAASIVMSLLWPSMGLSHLDNGYEGAWRGALVHKNFTGFLFSMGVLVVGYTLKAGFVSRWYAAVTWILCLVMLVKSASATSMVGTATAFAATGALVLARRADSPMRMILIGSFIVLCIPVTYIITNPAIVSGITGRDMTFTGRTVIWEAVLNLINLHPISGYGYGFWGLDSEARAYVWRWVGDQAAHSHNSWLDIWLQCGLFGLLALIGIVITTFYRGIVLFVTTNSHGVILFLAAMISTLVRSFTEVAFTDPGIQGLFWLALAAGYFGKLIQARDDAARAVTPYRRHALAPREISARPLANSARSLRVLRRGKIASP